MIRVAFIVLIALASGCGSTSINKITVPSGMHVGVVNGAFNASRERLLSVGAPVRDFGERVIRFQRGNAKSAHGYGVAQGNYVVGGWTIGKNVTLYEDPQGNPQPFMWEIESCHTWLQGIEASDYEFMQRAYPEWRKPK